MKIGILAYHSAYNFGANLQVLSTVAFLNNNGFEARVINWIAKDMEEAYDRSTPPLQIEAHKSFLQNYLPCTRLCRNAAEVAQTIDDEGMELIIVGSDAVLRHKPFLASLHISKKGIKRLRSSSSFLYPNPLWGEFIPLLKSNIPVVVMSGSSQNTEFKYIFGKMRRKMGKSLSQFRSITVRDEWTKNMVKYLTHGKIDPLVTPDPVFAYNQNVSRQYSKEYLIEKFNLPERYILVSFRTPNSVPLDWLKQFDQIAREHQFECIALTMPKGINFSHPFKHKIDAPLCPKEWYALIQHSSGYVGENMHPIVIALHNAVPFFAFDSYGFIRYKFFVNEKSSKTYDILHRAGFPEYRTTILGRKVRFPSPEGVLDRLINFDVDKCRRFSTQQTNRYNLMMQELLQFNPELV